MDVSVRFVSVRFNSIQYEYCTYFPLFQNLFEYCFRNCECDVLCDMGWLGFCGTYGTTRMVRGRVVCCARMNQSTR